jgi:hypothetical protein
MNDWRTITIGARTQYVVKVSAEDYDFLMQWRWTYAVSHKGGRLIYARRSIRCGDGNVTILMHRVVIERMGLERPSERHFVDHENGDSLDNRRVNDEELQQLRWLTPAENMANQRGVQSYPVGARPEAVGGRFEDIPF